MKSIVNGSKRYVQLIKTDCNVTNRYCGELLVIRLAIFKTVQQKYKSYILNKTIWI